MADPGPIFGPAQGSQSALLGREALKELLVATRIKGVRNVGFVVAEGWAVREVEDCLFGCGHQRRPQLGAYAFGVQPAGLALDETHDRRSVR